MRSDGLILIKLRCELRLPCHKQQLVPQCCKKSRIVLLPCNSQRNSLLHCRLQKWGVAREIFLATCNATFVATKVVRKIAPCNMFYSFTLKVGSTCCWVILRNLSVKAQNLFSSAAKCIAKSPQTLSLPGLFLFF